MAFNYDASARTADTLLKKFGAERELRSYDNSSHDPITGEITAPSFTSATVTAVLLSPTTNASNSSYKARGANQTVLERRKALISPTSAIEPSVGMVLVIDGIAWDIIHLTTLSPATTNVLYTAIVGRSSRTIS